MKKHFLVLSFIILCIFSYAQIHVWSPYSRFAVGELFFTSGALGSSMGGVITGIRNKNILNYSNPAALSAFEQQTFIFDAGVFMYPKILRTAELREHSMYANLSALGMAFSVSKRIGASITLVPLSGVGYKMKMTDTLMPAGKVEKIYEGWGGLNDFSVSCGASIWKGFSAGFQVHHIFGNINRKQVAIFDTAYTKMNTRITHSYLVHDFYISGGAQYEMHFRRSSTDKQPYRLVMGITGGNTRALKASTSILAVSFLGTNMFAPDRDTIFSSQSSTTITYPLWMTAGVVLEQNERWLVGADFAVQRWSDFRVGQVQDSLRDHFRVSLGFGFTPEGKMQRKNTYLLGFHYYKWYLELRNISLEQFGMSFGMLYPIRKSRTTMQFAFEIGKTGTVENGLIEEIYGKLKINVHFVEKMFFRRKYN